MKKILLISGLLIVVAIVLGAIYGYNKTKSHSPESTTTFQEGELKIDISYNRPFKKGRVIFGGLVPFGKTWRTGANEASVFMTNKDLKVGGEILKAGKYSFWTVPNQQSWTIVFNSWIPGWGIDVMKNGEAARELKYDVLVFDVPAMTTEKEFEQFTMSVEKADDMLELFIAWDKTVVVVPLSFSGQ